MFSTLWMMNSFIVIFFLFRGDGSTDNPSIEWLQVQSQALPPTSQVRVGGVLSIFELPLHYL